MTEADDGWFDGQVRMGHNKDPSVSGVFLQ